MDNNILEIKKEIEKQGVTGRQTAIKAGLPVNTVSRLLGGVTKKPDIEVIKKLQIALGIVAESEEPYAGSESHEQTTPEEREMLRYFRQLSSDDRYSTLKAVKALLLLAQQSGKNERPAGDWKGLKSV